MPKDCEKKMRDIVLAAISTIGVVYYLGLSTGDILGLIFFMLLLWGYLRFGFLGDKRKKIFATALALIFSAVMTLGKLGKNYLSIRDALKLNRDTIYKNESYNNLVIAGYSSNVDYTMLLICFLGLFIVFYFLLLRLANCLDKDVQRIAHAWDSKKVFWISFIT